MMSFVRGSGSSLPATQPESRVPTGQEYRFISRGETGQVQQEWQGQVEEGAKNETCEGVENGNQKSKTGLLRGSIGIMGNAVLHPINTTTSITRKIVQPLTDLVASIEEMGLPTFRRADDTSPSGATDDEYQLSSLGSPKPILSKGGKGAEEEKLQPVREEFESSGPMPGEASNPPRPARVRRVSYTIESDQTEHCQVKDEHPAQQPQQKADEIIAKEQLYLDVERRILAQQKIIEQLEQNARSLSIEYELHLNMLAEAERHRQDADQSAQLFRIEVESALEKRDKSRHEELEYEKLRLASYTRALELENERVRALAQLKLAEKKLDHFRELCSHHDTGIKRAEALLQKNKMEGEGALHQLKRLKFEEERFQLVYAAPPAPLVTRPLELNVTVKPQILLDCHLKPNVQQTDVHATALITEEVSAVEERLVGEGSQSAATLEAKQPQAFQSRQHKQTEIGGASGHMALKEAVQSSTNADEIPLSQKKGHFGFGLARKQIEISENSS